MREFEATTTLKEKQDQLQTDLTLLAVNPVGTLVMKLREWE